MLFKPKASGREDGKDDAITLMVFEPVCRGGEHLVHNSAMIQVMCRAFSSARVHLFAEADHLTHLKGCLGDSLSSRITAMALDLPGRGSSFIQGVFKDYVNLWLLFKKARSLENPVLVLLSCNAQVLFCVKFLMVFHARRLRVQVFIHSVLAKLFGWRSRNPLVRMLDFRTALTLMPGMGIQYIVLEETIKEDLARAFPSLAPHVAAIPHPIPPMPVRDGAGKKDSFSPLRFGYLGIVTESKGFSLFADVAGRMKKEGSPAACFDCIGFLGKEGHGQDLSCLDTKPADARLDRRDFSAGIKKLHYICLPYDRAQYRWSASGVLMDAVFWEKPVIARALPYVKRLFREFGPIGYLFEEDREYEEILRQLMNHFPRAAYLRQVANLRRIKSGRTIDRLAARYQELTG
jgi:glycosyltransferase involved in cell wall biosynthesis